MSHKLYKPKPKKKKLNTIFEWSIGTLFMATLILLIVLIAKHDKINIGNKETAVTTNNISAQTYLQNAVLNAQPYTYAHVKLEVLDTSSGSQKNYVYNIKTEKYTGKTSYEYQSADEHIVEWWEPESGRIDEDTDSYFIYHQAVDGTISAYRNSIVPISVDPWTLWSSIEDYEFTGDTQEFLDMNGEPVNCYVFYIFGANDSFYNIAEYLFVRVDNGMPLGSITMGLVGDGEQVIEDTVTAEDYVSNMETNDSKVVSKITYYYSNDDADKITMPEDFIDCR